MKKILTKTSMILMLVVGALASTLSALGAEYTVSSTSQLNSLSLSAGDVVTWTNGTYSNQNITFTGSGTQSNPITLKAETPGGVIFKGSSELNIYGSYLIMDGFFWEGGQGTSDHVEFRKSGSNSEFANNCTIRNCAFDDLSTTEPNKSRWIVLHGTNNVVENCSFVNKLSAGACILVELSYSGGNTPGHTIRNNYFYNITPKDNFSTNSGDCEAIRIGVSSYQAVSAQVLVEGNYFKAADGENEIITNKSADNTFLNNTFRNCRGSLVLRHGARAHIEGNFFLGEGKAKSGGIRVSDRDHVIINNYMQGLNNDGDVWNNGITLVGGGESSGGSGNGYQNVDNILVAFNTIYNSDDPIFYNDRNSHDPTGVIAYNLVYSTNGTIVAGDISGTGQGMTYVGNIFGGSAIGISDPGITQGDANFSPSGEIHKPSSSGIAANAAGSSYASLVDRDVEGLTRPNSNMDVGAHEVSGASGSSIYAPITDGDVGSIVGACFMSATGASASCASGGNVAVTGVSLAPASVSLTVGNTQQLSPSITPSNATDQGVSYSSSNTSVATVNSNGLVTAVSDGTATITVTTDDGGFTDTSSVTVSSSVSVTGVSLTPSSVSLNIGNTQQLSASVSPSNATDQGVSYSSNNTSIATVSASGLVTAVSEGSATITVTTDDGGFTDTSSITVSPPPSGTNLALNKSVTATGTPDGANVEANLVDGDPDSRWSVSGFPQSATVDLGAVFSIEATEVICYSDRAYQYIIEASTNGSSYATIVDRSSNTTPGTNTSPITDSFSPVDARYVRITVSGAASYTGSWVSLDELRVFGEEGTTNVPVTGVSVTPASVSLEEGTTQQLTVSVSPSNATDQGVSYGSSNTSVATVNASGLVTAVSEGTATITVTTDDGGFTDTSSVTVTASAVSVTGVSLTPSSTSLDIGNTQQLSASVSPSNATDQGVSYSSSNTSVATVNASGLVTAVSAGSATITVTTDDGGFTDTSVITVNAPSTGSNLALNKPVTGTGTPDGANVEANLVDGDPDSRWSVSGFPQSATVDLGAVFSIESTEVICYDDRAYQYIIEASTNGSSYSTIVDRSSNTTPGTNTSPITDSFSPVDARYIRITVSGAASYTGSWVSMEELRVFGDEGSTNVPVTGVSLTPSSATVDVGQTQQLTASISPSNATDLGVSYSSSNNSVATVNSSGLVTAVSAGNATITVTTDDGGFTDASAITVQSGGGGTWTVISSEDFESGWGIWNDGGADASLYTGGSYAHQGSSALNIQDDTNSSVVSTENLSLGSYADLKVDFWFRPESMENGEDFWLQISTDGGSNYSTVQSWVIQNGSSYENYNFYQESVELLGYTLTDQTSVRFRCYASGNSDDVYLDEIVISARTSSSSRTYTPPANALVMQNPKTELSVYPNPIRGVATIQYAISEDTHVELSVYNMAGQKVEELINETRSAGSYELKWAALTPSGDSLPTGIYIARIILGDEIKSIRMMVSK